MRIEIVDVGPRDGLQNEDRTLSPEVRAELCEKLAAAGVPRVEAASFVNPKRVPQMAGAEEVMAAIERSPGTTYAGLVLNEKGYELVHLVWYSHADGVCQDELVRARCRDAGGDPEYVLGLYSTLEWISEGCGERDGDAHSV
jgi:hypothetical protein